mgnify:CR=1 FL=1
MFSRALRGMLRRAPALTLVLALTLAQAACSGGPASSPDDFELVAQLDVGRNPHQISFFEDGRTAYVASPSSTRLASSVLIVAVSEGASASVALLCGAASLVAAVGGPPAHAASASSRPGRLRLDIVPLNTINR